MMRLELATAEYIGARAQQQDLAAAVPLPAGAVLVLADGLGGHESGADASRIVVETFREASQGGRFNNADTRRQALRETVDRANARIGEGVDPTHGHRGMASTVVAAVVANGEVSWVSVGDSHLYLWRGGRLRKLNEDHSQAGLMVRSGQYKVGDPEVQAVKSVLVSALTGRKLDLVDLPQRGFKIEPGDVLVLASDGLNTLDDAEIEGIVGEVRTSGAAKLSTTLLERVRSRRVERQDNATVAIARVLEPAVARVDPKPVAMPAAPAIDLDAEARTERFVPPPITPEPTGMSVPTAPVVPAKAPSEPPSAAAPVMEADAVPVEPAAKPADPPKTPTAAAASSPAPEVAAPQFETSVEAAPEPRVPAAAQGETAAAGLTPTSAAGDKLRHAAGNGARVSLPRAPLPSPVPRPSPPRIQLSEPSEAATRPTDALEPPPLKLPRPGWTRVVTTVLLVWMIAMGVAFAAIAALKPQWLAGIVPGFGETVDKERPAPASAPVQPPTPSASPATPAEAPMPVPATKLPTPEPATKLPTPVPATKLPTPESPARPEAGEAAKTPVAPPPQTGEARRAQPSADPAAAKPSEPAPAGAQGPPAPGTSQTQPTAADTAVDPSTLQAAPATTSDPPLVEPQQPAPRPAQQGPRQRRNGPAQAPAAPPPAASVPGNTGN